MKSEKPISGLKSLNDHWPARQIPFNDAEKNNGLNQEAFGIDFGIWSSVIVPV